MMNWIIGILIALSIVFFLIAKLNRRSCLHAFGQGVNDAVSISWGDIIQKFNSFLSPFRPMDAAAYQRGLEYCLLSPEGSGWEDIKRDFVDSYKSGAITNEGTNIRRLGAKNASQHFNLRVSKELVNLIIENPELPPMVAKIQIEQNNT
jgi:hypothetical protein